MGFPNPSDPSEILYGASGDVRDEINAHAASGMTAGHYVDEAEMPGSLVVRSLRKATREINAYLEIVYADQIPFTTTGSVPVLLDEISTDVATFYCMRSMTSALGPISEDKKWAYYDKYFDKENGLLAMIRDGEVQLPELTSVTPGDVKMVRSSDTSPIFDVDSDLNHRVDPRVIEDIENERE